MNKFKVGDKVKVIKEESYNAPLGTVGVITEVVGEDPYSYTVDYEENLEGCTIYFERELELFVEQKELTDEEAFQALLEGKKLTKDHWQINDFICINEEGFLVDEEGDEISFNSSYRYKIFAPTKQKKKVTLYRMTYHYVSNPGEISQTPWTSDSKYVTPSDYIKILKTETKEVEYEVEEDA